MLLLARSKGRKNITWLGSNADLNLMNRIVEHIGKNMLTIYDELIKICKKNIIAIETPKDIYYIIEKAEIHKQIHFRFIP